MDLSPTTLTTYPTTSSGGGCGPAYPPGSPALENGLGTESRSCPARTSPRPSRGRPVENRPVCSRVLCVRCPARLVGHAGGACEGEALRASASFTRHGSRSLRIINGVMADLADKASEAPNEIWWSSQPMIACRCASLTRRERRDSSTRLPTQTVPSRTMNARPTTVTVRVTDSRCSALMAPPVYPRNEAARRARPATARAWSSRTGPDPSTCGSILGVRARERLSGRPAPLAPQS